MDNSISFWYNLLQTNNSNYGVSVTKLAMKVVVLKQTKLWWNFNEILGSFLCRQFCHTPCIHLWNITDKCWNKEVLNAMLFKKLNFKNQDTKSLSIQIKDFNDTNCLRIFLVYGTLCKVSWQWSLKLWDLLFQNVLVSCFGFTAIVGIL